MTAGVVLVVDERVVDCVVSEYDVPDGAGELFRASQRLLRELRERDPDLPFVLFTDASDAAVAREAAVAGVTTLIRKEDRPAADDLLADRVAGAVDRRRAMRRADRHQSITATMRDLNAALVRADSRAAIQRRLPAELTPGPYEFAAFVTTDGTDATVAAVDGTDPPLTVGDAVDPDAVTVDTVTVYDDADDVPGETGTDGPLAETTAGDRRVAVAPVSYGDRQFGVVVLATDDADAFDETERAVLEELGETAGYAIDAVETRDELERQNDRLERFTAVVSHDLRSPLEVADVYLDAARDERDADELRRVSEAHDRMRELVDDVLTLARDGQTVVDPEPFDLETLARDAWSTVDATGASLVVDATDTFAGDPSRVRQLFENLFANAVEHSSTSPASQARQDAVEHSSTSPHSSPTREDAVEHAGATTDPANPGGDVDGETVTDGAGRDHVGATDSAVTVRVGAFDDGFYVADDGPGIPEDEREDVFEMGYTTADSGTGYGLAIVAELAAAHGWAVAVTESGDGGARFEITTA